MGDVPPGVTTVTLTVPACAAGLVTTIWVAVSLTIVAAVDPNFTAVALARPVPVITTDVPPAIGPADVLRNSTAGTGT